MLKNKNILYIVHNYNSFQKDPIEELAKYFKKVYVLVRYKPISRIIKYLPIRSLKRYEDEHAVDLSSLPENVEVVRTPVWYLPMPFFYKILGDLHYQAVDKVIKRNKIRFDLIHAHFTWSSGYVAKKLKEKYKVPFVVTVHENPDWFLEELSSEDEKLYSVWENADALIRVNKKTVKDLRKFNNNVSFISNSFNEKLFFQTDKHEARRFLDIKSEGKILLNIGHLEELKGQIHLVRAIDILVKEYNYENIHLYIVGEGTLRKTLENEIKKLELEKNITLLGKQYHRDIPVWMNASDLFVLPSIIESFGVVQIEALGCGKPVVASRNEGSKEVILSEKYGYLSNVADPKDLAIKIDMALKKNWDKDEIIKYAKTFGQSSINETLLNLYRSILKDND